MKPNDECKQQKASCDLANNRKLFGSENKKGQITNNDIFLQFYFVIHFMVPY